MPRGEKIIKTISGREYEYSVVDIKSSANSRFLVQAEVYEKPVERVQERIMERLTVIEQANIEEKWRRGRSITEIADYIRNMTGIKPAESTIYGYFRRKKIKREKRKTREAERSIILSELDAYRIDSAWMRGESWQDIQKHIYKICGRKPAKRTLYAYFKDRGIKRR